MTEQLEKRLGELVEDRAIMGRILSGMQVGDPCLPDDFETFELFDLGVGAISRELAGLEEAGVEASSKIVSKTSVSHRLHSRFIYLTKAPRRI